MQTGAASRGFSGFQQVRIFGMFFDVALHELAFRDHLQSIGPHLVERTPDQPGADAFAAKLWRHFGMDECDDAVGYLVIGRGNMAVDFKFVAAMRRVVGNRVVISSNSSLYCPGALFPACCRLQNCVEWVLQEQMLSPRFNQTYAPNAAGLVA